tara:strand:- start:11847 stop:12986 length:1140 start_codon:yes stop_codon:yes gene_type:complete
MSYTRIGEYYVMNLNWGDGSDPQFTDKPKRLYDDIDLFEHVYDKPGFYTITGLVFAINNIDNPDKKEVMTWERFKSNIVINESNTYDTPYFEEEDFIMIGGYSEDSTYFKTMLVIGGYNFDKEIKTNIVNIEEYNEFDKIKILDTLMKFDGNLYNTYLDAYTKPIYDGDELINNNYSSKKYKDILKTTGLNNVDVGSCKMYTGVRKMNKHLGFNNTSPANDPNKDEYWNNIIPKKWKWTDREGIDYGIYREPISGSKALIEEYKEYHIDDSATQSWVNGYWPVLPKINKVGKFVNEVTSSYGFTNVAIGEPEGRGGEKSLILDIDFNQDTVNDLIDRTSQFEIKGTFDFSVEFDDKIRVQKGEKDNIELMEKRNSEQAF